MKIPKYLIEEFIKKVYRKALSAVEDKYKTILIDISIAHLEKEGKRELFEELQASIDKYVACSQSVLDFVEKHFTAVAYNSSAINKVSFIDYNVKVEEGEPVKTIDVVKSLLTWMIPTDNAEAKELFNQYQKDKQDVDVNYRAIQTNTAAMANGNKAYNYLKELGFDVSWIDDKINKGETSQDMRTVDKSKLFPCGDNK